MRRFSPLLALALCAALPVHPVAAESPAPILCAPESGRQGDPLLVWALSQESLVGAELKLAPAEGNAGGGTGVGTVLSAHGFAAPDSLLASVLPEAATSGASRGPAVHLYGFLLALPTTAAPGRYRLELSPPPAAVSATMSATTPTSAAGPGPRLVEQPFSVVARSFVFERIPLDQANSDLLTVPDARKTEEARRLYVVFATVEQGDVFADAEGMLRPVTPLRKTAGFGDRRRYLYPDGSSSLSVHEGEDLAVPTGTPVLSCARGKVVLCALREVTGNSIVVEHLPGLYSIYYHLSAIEVKEGQMVERGQELGRSGSTGLSTGPHLHWELRAMGQAVDPEYWLGSPLLDTKRIQATITALFEGR